MIDAIKQIDTSLFLFFNSHHSPFWDNIMWLISSKYTWIPLYLFLVFIIIKKEKRKVWLVLLLIALTITLSDQISVFIKNTVARYRPCHNLYLQHIVHLVKNHCGGQYGFVSSHSANSFALAAFFYFSYRRKIWLWMFLWATIVAYSRIYLGVHYPADIIAGGLLGITIGYLMATAKNTLTSLSQNHS